jgi:uncharacterized membrane protein
MMIEVPQEILMFAAAGLLAVILVLAVILRNLSREMADLKEEYARCRQSGEKQDKLIEALQDALSLLSERAKKSAPGEPPRFD